MRFFPFFLSGFGWLQEELNNINRVYGTGSGVSRESHKSKSRCVLDHQKSMISVSVVEDREVWGRTKRSEIGPIVDLVFLYPFSGLCVGTVVYRLLCLRVQPCVPEEWNVLKRSHSQTYPGKSTGKDCWLRSFKRSETGTLSFWKILRVV